MNKIWELVKKHGPVYLEYLVFFAIAAYFFWMPALHKDNPVLKDYKDGVQNHLTWDIKGQCFFVRPQTEQTVLLVRVQDCDKK